MPLVALDPLEMCTGMVFGPRRTPAPTPDPPLDAGGVAETLEALLLPALVASPCLVAFSGGRDSSTLLAVLAGLARRHGLDAPVPITVRFGEHPRTREDEWQELVVRHLALTDWQVLIHGSELDAVGAIAGEALRRHGPYWPGNAHAIAPLLRAAAGGTLVTGTGGDEVFTAVSQRSAESPAHAARTYKRVGRRVLSAAPFGIRLRIQYRSLLRLRWLRPRTRREIRHRFVEMFREAGSGAADPIERLHGSRYFELARSIFAALAGDAGAALSQPFLDARFFRAALDAAPPAGFPSRGDALDAWFRGILPSATIRRSTKARFTEVLWGRESRAFARRWDGSGLDLALIDPDGLRAEWSRVRPDLRSVTPLQAAWLRSHASLGN